MTQTTDPTIVQIRAWLAEQPCPVCKGAGEIMVAALRGYELEPPEPITCSICQGTGLAFPWASKECTNSWHKREYWLSQGYLDKFSQEHCKPGCFGSGRVPKAVGLEELAMRFEIELHPPGGLTEWVAILPMGEQGEGETPMLAALRAIAAKAGMR